MTDYNFQPKGYKSKQGWYFRNLPHFDGGEIAQFLTARLYDSLPANVIEHYRKQLEKNEDKAEFRKEIEKYLDRGHGECFLKNPKVAKLVQDSLLFYNGSKYKLFAWVIMPNHIHILLKPGKNIELSEITHSIKSYTAHKANNLLKRKGQFWQHETFDRYIRNRRHLVNVIRYVENNPVKAGLCDGKANWRFGSAYFRENNLEF